VVAHAPLAFARLVHFGCSRCGACCNSNPQMSLPELFRHQALFIGCLGIRRTPHASGGVAIASQAYDDPLAQTCSALGEDKLCSLQTKGKPLACRSVPLEAALPDALQLSVLQERARDARFMGAECIQPRTELDPTVPGHLPVIVEGPRVVDPEARRALELRRAALRQDRAYWGDRVFQMLGRELFEHPARGLRLPEQGSLCMSLAPALSVISSLSNALTRRVLEYLNAQIELVALTVGAPVKEPTQAQRELAGMLRANVSLRAKLQSARPLPQPEPRAPAVEAWLAERDLEAARE
jgi:hypothetical protein